MHVLHVIRLTSQFHMCMHGLANRHCVANMHISQTIVRKYTEKGYGTAVPEIVFRNLRHSRATPVPGNQKGVALLSGFSKNLLKLFFDSEGDIDKDPEKVMEAAISGVEYQKLVVVD
ncbi:hypothetical protein LWI29_034418 [Acer saccharum]|uniref:DUF7788 domain-containing protein n=1 Tax=Acer saccharum TaxID=4024 RepID=A0AA39RJZ6_ACESA|nr:hypothetical protein LWI29_034418 [Acer saccharum]